MVQEIEIDLGDLGSQIAMVSALVDSDYGVTLTHVRVTVAGILLNVVTMIDEQAKEYIRGEYLELHQAELNTIDGKHLYDEHDYS